MKTIAMFRAIALSALATCALWGQQKKAVSPVKPPAPSPAKSGKSALDKPTMEAYIRHQFMLPSQLQVIVDDPKPSELPGLFLVNVTVTDGGQTNQKVPFYVTRDGSKLMQAKVYDAAKSPFDEELRGLKIGAAATHGPADAPVTVFVFSDFQCQFCREAAKSMREGIAANYPKQVRIVFKDFPLEQIHPWARPAALAGRCVLKQGAEPFWKFHDWIFEQQPSITPDNLKAKVMEFANANGVDSLQLSQCIDAKAADMEVAQSVEEGRMLNVDRTPTVFVNGRRIGNPPWDQFKSVIDYESDYARKNPAPKKDDACCEIRLPIPAQR